MHVTVISCGQLSRLRVAIEVLKDGSGDARQNRRVQAVGACGLMEYTTGGHHE